MKLDTFASPTKFIVTVDQGRKTSIETTFCKRYFRFLSRIVCIAVDC